MMYRRLAIALALLLVLPTIALIAPIAAQNQFPANAVIRGENVRVRAEPTGNAANNAILQRGDAIVLTGPVEARPDGEFYPVQVPGTGATGWILSLFIDPASITPGAATTVVVAPTAAPVAPTPPPAAAPNVEVVVEPTVVVQPTVVVDVPPTPTAVPAAAPATPPAKADNANGNKNNKNKNKHQKENGTPTPAATPEKVGFSGKGATTTDPATIVAGKYKVSAAMTVKTATAFSAVLNGPNQFSQTLFNETIDQPQDWTAETDVTIPATGDYTITVSNANASWKIRFVPA